MTAIEPRTLRIAEYTGAPFICGHCQKRVPDGLGFTVELIEDAGAIPVDGVFCSELCADREGEETTILEKE